MYITADVTGNINSTLSEINFEKEISNEEINIFLSEIAPGSVDLFTDIYTYKANINDTIFKLKKVVDEMPVVCLAFDQTRSRVYFDALNQLLQAVNDEIDINNPLEF